MLNVCVFQMNELILIEIIVRFLDKLRDQTFRKTSICYGNWLFISNTADNGLVKGSYCPSVA